MPENISSVETEQEIVRIPFEDNDGVVREKEFHLNRKEKTLTMADNGRVFRIIGEINFTPIRVRAVGEANRVVGYYNHVRLYGGNIFELRPYFTKRVDPRTRRPYIDPKTNKPLIDPITGSVMLDTKSGAKPSDVVLTPPCQIGTWMEIVDKKERLTRPQTYKNVGLGDARRVRAAERQANSERDVI